MRAAGLALACVVVGGAVAIGYLAADRDAFAALRALDFFELAYNSSEAKVYPQANRDGKFDRMAPLRTERADVEPVLQRGDSLRQSYAAVDPAATAGSADHRTGAHAEAAAEGAAAAAAASVLHAAQRSCRSMRSRRG